jgi:DNA-binding MarR family transcriptional regulator
MSLKFFEIVLRIKRSCVETEDRIRSEFGLTEAECNGLLAIGPEERIAGAEFSARMGLSPSRGSRVLSRLAKKGLLCSVTPDGDRRSLVISMTPAGARTRRSLEERMEACGRGLLEKLSPAERRRVEASLRLMEKTFTSMR